MKLAVTFKKFAVSMMVAGAFFACDTDDSEMIETPSNSPEIGDGNDSLVVTPPDSVPDQNPPPVELELDSNEVLVDGQIRTVDIWIEADVSDFRAERYNIQPGAVIAFRGGEGVTRTYIDFRGVKGTESEPIIITNKGKVNISSNIAHKHAIKFIGCTNIRLLGNGDPEISKGITVAQSGSSGVAIGDYSSDFEVAHLEIKHVGFAGILAKTDGGGSSGFVMKNLDFHHNIIHDTHGEGMYIGQTKVDGAHAIVNLKVHHNLIYNTGWDLFQVANTTENIEVYNNTMVNGGLGNVPMQNQGFQIGDWSGGKYYNNIIMNSQSRLLFVKGGHNIELFNNYFSTQKDAEFGFLKTEKRVDRSSTLTIRDNWFRDYPNGLFKSMISEQNVAILNNKYDPRDPNSRFIEYSNGGNPDVHRIEGNVQEELPAIKLTSDFKVEPGSYYDGYDLGYEANGF